ncbi:HEAT repeat domain-containing protein [Halorubrum lipolyticum]|uniref:PBS lyase n=1 Tax=Halorubrum lipolyticum DSM 21995 TaxID=1227482 RepID=M0P2X3_9EURY|nr:HEAT repeat domain-containing protein [Halorubrum lipolyticum]EMA63889.1 PBS lyase [Halorubrum lipolyticum DSM 21995]
MRDPDEATDGPTDPRVHPEESPGFGEEPDGLEDIEVSRDVTIGDASPRELQATDTAPLRGTDVAEKIADLVDGDPVARRRAALALGEGRPTEAALDALTERGLTDGDADVRQFAVEALGQLGGERAGEAAVAACDDSDPWVRAEAVVALDRIDRSEHAATIEAALDDDHHAVVRNAAVSLFKLRGEALCPVLLELSHADSERLREWAVHLLAGVDDDRAASRLEAVASDETQPKVVRSTAVRALDADAGKFRRQFSGGTENDSADLPGESALNRRPDL